LAILFSCARDLRAPSMTKVTYARTEVDSPSVMDIDRDCEMVKTAKTDKALDRSLRSGLAIAMPPKDVGDLYLVESTFPSQSANFLPSELSLDKLISNRPIQVREWPKGSVSMDWRFFKVLIDWGIKCNPSFRNDFLLHTADFSLDDFNLLLFEPNRVLDRTIPDIYNCGWKIIRHRGNHDGV